MLALNDSGTSLFTRRAGVAVDWAFRHDRDLPLPYDNKLDSMVNAPAFKAIEAGDLQTRNQIRKLGNRATHDKKQPPVPQAVEILQKLFCSVNWFGHTYGRSQT